MSKFKVVITDHEYTDISNEIEILEKAGASVVDCRTRNSDLLLKELRDCDGLITQYAPITGSMINQMTKCRVISKYATGTDNIDITAATENKICFCNVNEYCTEEVSDHALAMIMALNRKLKQYDTNISKGRWHDSSIMITPLRTSIIGIIGFGKTSISLIRKLRPLCNNIWVFSNHASFCDVEDLGARLVTFDELICNADYISLHTSLTDESRHLLTCKEFARMKNTASVINLGRGSLICEEDLIDALTEGQIASAALDVLEEEPAPITSPLRQMSNVILTPHAAWYSEGSQVKLQRTAAQNVVDVLTGVNPGENLVNKELSYLFD